MLWIYPSISVIITLTKPTVKEAYGNEGYHNRMDRYWVQEDTDCYVRSYCPRERQSQRYVIFMKTE